MSDDPPVHVDNVEQVTVTSPAPAHLPYAKFIAAFSLVVMAGFAAVTGWVLSGEAGRGIDAATKGALIQTWNNLALMAATFWVGSSLGGKMAAQLKEKT